MCSLVLLTSAGLFLRSLVAGAAIAPGFDEAGVVVTRLDTEAYGYAPARGRAFYDALRRAVERASDVEAVSFSTMVPLTFADSGGMAIIDATPGTDAKRFIARRTLVSPGYFSTLRIPLISGRDFPAVDAEGLRTAIVNETFARRAWGEGDPRGRTFTLSDRRVTVIAVARDSHYTTLDEAPTPFVYLPFTQQWPSAQTLFVRGRGGAAPRAALIEAAVLAFDPSLPLPVVSTLRDETAVVLLPQRVAAIVTVTLGALGLLLAAVGLYGLVAHAVSLRMREIGVRMALGAHATTVIRLMLTDSIRLVAVGTGLGLLASLLATRLLAGYLLTISPLDPLAFVGAALLLTAVTVAASAIPARRAGRVSPVDVLARDGA
jgi:predicted permease